MGRLGDSTTPFLFRLLLPVANFEDALVPRFHRIDGCFARAAPPRIAALDCFPGLRPNPKFAPRIS